MAVLMKSHIAPGDGGTAPLRVVLRDSEGVARFTTHLENREGKYYFEGHYFNSLAHALEDFAKRCQKLKVEPELPTERG